jgi:hypothetical protein
MSRNSKRASAEEKNVDEATSSACTKSGALAMLISVALLCLIPYWQHRPAEIALARYVTSRVLLDMNLDQLDQNPAWQYYRESHGDAEVISISHLPERFPYPPPQWKPQSNDPGAPQTSRLRAPDAGQVEAGHQRSDSALSVALIVTKLQVPHKIAWQLPPTNSPNRPAAPTNGTATAIGPLPELEEIKALTKQINESKQLLNAGHYSNYYSVSIARWIQKERMLVWNDQLQQRCSTKSIDLPAKEGSPSEPDPDVLFDCLSIRDWRELAKYEMPSTGSAEQNQIGDGIGKAVDIGVGALPHRGDLASFVAAAMLIVTLLYFGAFLREAVHSVHFPATATLFSAFSRTPSANLAMFLALCFPFLSSAILAVVSKSWLLYVEDVLIGLVTIWTLVGFQQKSYFRAALTLLRTRQQQEPISE